jgi:hypothetical protein
LNFNLFLFLLLAMKNHLQPARVQALTGRIRVVARLRQCYWGSICKKSTLLILWRAGGAVTPQLSAGSGRVTQLGWPVSQGPVLGNTWCLHSCNLATWPRVYWVVFLSCLTLSSAPTTPLQIYQTGWESSGKAEPGENLSLPLALAPSGPAPFLFQPFGSSAFIESLKAIFKSQRRMTGMATRTRLNFLQRPMGYLKSETNCRQQITEAAT